MSQDTSRQSESTSAVQTAEDRVAYSLSSDLPSKPVASAPKIATSTEKVVGRRPRRRTLRIQISPDDRQTQHSWLEKFAMLAYLASFLIHLGLVLWMAYWTLQNRAQENELLLAGGEIVGVDPKLEEIEPIEIDLNVGEKSLASPSRQRVDLVKRENIDGDIPSSINDRIGETAISGEDLAGDLGFGNETGDALPGGNIRRGKNAVTKGSFTAWTVPEKPKVGRTYLIVIQIELPDKIERYRASDLRGIILGTDTYSQRLPFEPRIIWQHTFRLDPEDKNKVQPVNRPPRDWLPIKDNVVTLVVKVPGARRAQVEDTIRIKSKLLKEKQTLKIVFSSQ